MSEEVVEINKDDLKDDQISKKEQYKMLCDYVKRKYKEIGQANEQRYLGQDKVFIKGYDLCDEINLWTYWQGRGVYSPKIMLIGQDWGCPFSDSNDTMAVKVEKAKNQAINPAEDRVCHYFDQLGKDDFVFKTDENMAQLFRSLELGYDDLLHVRYDDLFFTNICLGYRNETNSGGFKKSWITDVERNVYPKLIEILKPKVIICLGKETYECFLRVMDEKDVRSKSNFNDFIEQNNLNPFQVNEIPVFAFAHCGSMGTLNRNDKKNTTLEMQKEDWSHIKKYLVTD